MIRLSFQSPSQPRIFLFNKTKVLIGGDATLVDVPISFKKVEPIHLEIVESNGVLLLINVVNDPFAALNGQPFGKKKIKTGDMILVGDQEILFERLSDFDNPATKTIKKETSTPEASTKESSINPITMDLSFENEVSPFESEEEMAQFLKAIDQPTHSDGSKLVEPPSQSIQGRPSQMISNRRTLLSSLKEDYLKEFEDKPQPANWQNNGPQEESSHLYQAWKWIIFFIFSILVVAGLLGTLIYFTVSDKTEAQETAVAQIIADISMALMNAQLHHTKPINQNWSDVDFLKENLHAILPHRIAIGDEVDAQGNFLSLPYCLRIYTNNDISRFLLIAQPAPSFLQSFIPKSVILIDSQVMELRVVKDVRNLNRLLAHPDPLEGINGREIFTLVKQGEMIRLSSLVTDGNYLDFMPPKNLAWIKPGAENFIYNAPRYHRLTEGLVMKAAAIAENKGNSQDIAPLKQEIDNLSSLKNLTVYAELGKREAKLAKQGVLMIDPVAKLIFGYLVFNTEGHIHQVHLLKDEENPAVIYPMSSKEDSIVLEDSQQISHKLKGDYDFENEENVEFKHPVYFQLVALAKSRENELSSIHNRLQDMLKEELIYPKPDFYIDFQNLSHEFLMLDAKYKEQIRDGLKELYALYEDLPTAQFMNYVEKAGLEYLIQENAEERSIQFIDESIMQNFETMLIYIERSKDLLELDNYLHIASSWLDFDYIKTGAELLKYQTLLRNKVLDTLSNFILRDKQALELKPENRIFLERILNLERIIKPEEREFFLQEFDHILKMQD